MPDRTECRRCKRTGFVRVEHVIKGDKAERQFFCGACDYTWSVWDEDGPTLRPDKRPERSRR
jgi:hypothetical protein